MRRFLLAFLLFPCAAFAADPTQNNSASPAVAANSPTAPQEATPATAPATALAKAKPAADQVAPPADGALVVEDPVKPQPTNAGQVLQQAAAATPKLEVTLMGLDGGGRIPEKYAYCAPDKSLRTKDGGNRNPELRWSKGPEATRSYVVIMVDPDVPTSFDDANKVDRELPSNMPRQNFYHWVLVDIPPAVNALPEGIDSSGVKKGGKAVGKFAYGVRGVNDYAKFYGGTHGGYDGPCPPWNDTLAHHYHFKVYALDVPTLNLSGKFDAGDAMSAMQGHILAEGEAVGTYTQNTSLPPVPPLEENNKKEAD